jgi:hypothetical protein
VIVVDIGCHPQGHEESVYKLCRAFQPSVLFGFDPFPDLEPGVEFFTHSPPRRRRERWEQTVIVRSRLAAWTYDGFVSYRVSDDPITSGVVPPGHSAAAVPCFDLVAWLKTLPMPEEQVVLKMDAEGSEYRLLWAIHDAGLDLLLHRALIEYHPESTANGLFEGDRPPLRCEVEDWDLHW